MAQSALDECLTDLFGGGCLARVTRTESGSEESHLRAAELSVIARAVPKRRREFSAGRKLAQDLLAELGAVPRPLLPDSDRCPIWPRGFRGSISHCAELCAVVVSADEKVKSVGLDIEPSTPLEARLVERICRPGELAGLGAQQKCERAKLLFSIKEAVYKCQFPISRTFLGFHDVEVELQEGLFHAVIHEQQAALMVGREISGRFALRGGHVLSAARLDQESESQSGSTLRP
jgi:4'-phosphopantetheinyl transferase EntD